MAWLDRTAGGGQSGSMLHPFATELWIADGGVADVAGFRYPTRMAVVRLANGGLLLWSPTEMTDGLRDAVTALGPVRHLVAPNSLHHLHLAPWKAAFPQALLHAAPGLRERRVDLAFDADLTDAPHPDWAGELDQVMVRGNLITTEVVFFHRAGRTALFTDLIQQFRPGWFSGWRALVARLDRMTGPEPQVPNKFRTAFIDRRAARQALDRIGDWPVEKVLMAHGEPVTTGGAAFITRAFAWLRARSAAG